MSNYEELEKINQLKKDGLLTEQEFETEKQKILQATNSGQQSTIKSDGILDEPTVTELKSNGAATASLVLSLIGLLIVPLLLGLIAVILGGVGLSKDRAVFKGHGAATAGLVIGIIDLIWGVFWIMFMMNR